MTDWLTELEDDLKNVARSQRHVPKAKRNPIVNTISKRKKIKPIEDPRAKPAIKKASNSYLMPLFFLFLFLVAGLAAAIRYKSQAVTEAKPTPSFEVPKTPIDPVQPTEPPNLDAKKLVDLTEEVEDLRKKMSKYSVRIRLLGALHNNNFMSLSKRIPNSDYVIFNRDWTINKMPDHLTLDSNDRAFLQSQVR